MVQSFKRSLSDVTRATPPLLKDCITKEKEIFTQLNADILKQDYKDVNTRLNNEGYLQIEMRVPALLTLWSHGKKIMT